MSDKITTEQMQGALFMLLLKEREHLRKNPTVHDYLKAIGSRLADYDALEAEVERLKKKLEGMTANRNYWERESDKAALAAERAAKEKP